jgi:hypothetical protein
MPTAKRASTNIPGLGRREQGLAGADDGEDISGSLRRRSSAQPLAMVVIDRPACQAAGSAPSQARPGRATAPTNAKIKDGMRPNTGYFRLLGEPSNNGRMAEEVLSPEQNIGRCLTVILTGNSVRRTWGLTLPDH